MLCVSGFELYSRWVPLLLFTRDHRSGVVECQEPILIIESKRRFQIKTINFFLILFFFCFHLLLNRL